jgi:hypothetical protein
MSARPSGQGGRDQELVWPDEEIRLGIEAALAVRPNVNRNWTPTETIDDLHAENAEHGL